MSLSITIETPQQAARRLMASKLLQGYRPEALHSYTDTKGNPLYWRIRLKHPTLDKLIRPMALIDGDYLLKEPQYPHGQKPLYHLQQLARDTSGKRFHCREHEQ